MTGIKETIRQLAVRGVSIDLQKGKSKESLLRLFPAPIAAIRIMKVHDVLDEPATHLIRIQVKVCFLE